MSYRNKIPLVVDLDRTFLRYDTFKEDCALMVKRPSGAIKMLKTFWRGGRAALKIEAAKTRQYQKINYRLNPEFQDFLRREQKNRPLWLFTGAAAKHAFAINERYPYFTKILATTSNEVVTPKKKLAWLARHDIKFFDYAGDRNGDFVIFQQARVSYLVNPTLVLLIRTYLARSSVNVKFFDIPKKFNRLKTHILVRSHKKKR